MSSEESRTQRVLSDAAAMGSAAAGGRAADRLTVALGGATRARVVVVLACVLGLSGADFATVGASATELRSGLGITNTDIGLLVAVTSLTAAVATMPFGVLADRVRRTSLGAAIALWSIAMFWSAVVTNFNELLLSRLFLGIVTASAGPLVASLVGDYFRRPSAAVSTGTSSPASCSAPASDSASPATSRRSRGARRSSSSRFPRSRSRGSWCGSPSRRAAGRAAPESVTPGPAVQAGRS